MGEKENLKEIEKEYEFHKKICIFYTCIIFFFGIEGIILRKLHILSLFHQNKKKSLINHHKRYEIPNLNNKYI